MLSQKYATVNRFKPASLRRLALAGILLAGLLLRVYHINQPYTDIAGWRECSMAMMADNFYHRNPNILFPEVSWNGPGESYNGREFQTVTYSSQLLYRLFGQHDWVGRMVNVFFGIWGVFALYCLVKRIWGHAHALAAAAVMALLPAAVYFDRSFLPDPAMVSLVTTGLWLFIAYLQNGKARWLYAAGAVLCLGFLTKITGMITLLPLLYAFIVISGARRQLTLSNTAKVAGVALAVFAAVAAYYLWARYLSLHYPPYHFAGEGNWVWNDGLAAWLSHKYYLPDLGYIFQNWTLGTPFIVLGIAGAVVVPLMHKNEAESGFWRDGNARYLFHFWLLAALVFYAIGAKELVWNFWNFHIWSPMIAAFAGAAIVGIFRLLQWRPVAVSLIASALFVWIGFSDRRVLRNTFTDEYYKAEYDMGRSLRALRRPGDLSIVLAKDIGNPIALFYSGGRGWVFPPAGKENWDRLPPTEAAFFQTLAGLRRQGAAWFAINRAQFDTIETAFPAFAKYLQTHFQLAVNQPAYVIFNLKP